MFAFTKKTLVVSALAAAVFSLSACNQDSKAQEAAAAKDAAPAQTAAAAPAPAVTAESKFEDKVSYCIGASLGTYISQMLKVQSEFLGEVDHSLIEQGFKDSLAGNSALDTKTIEDTLRQLDQKIQEAVAAKAKAEAQANLEAGKKFLEENAKKDGVKTTESGLQYKVIKEGTGKQPKTGDVISVKYKGTTIDGNVFDEQKEAVDFPLENMIKGWVEGLQLMNEGAVFEFYIPAELAYGESGAGDVIKPNSVLVFNVELVGVKNAETVAKEAKAADEAAKAVQEAIKDVK